MSVVLIPACVQGNEARDIEMFGGMLASHSHQNDSYALTMKVRKVKKVRN